MENNKPEQNEDNKKSGDSSEKYLPVDPSNTSHMGQKADTGIVEADKGLAQQSNEWEDSDERKIPDESIISPKAEEFLKNPSPEVNDIGSEITNDAEQDESIK